MAKACSKCGKPVEPSYARWGRRCRACRRETHRRWEAKHAHKETLRAREKNWTKLGIRFLAREYDALLSAQDGRCAICRSDRARGKGSFHVDHDHRTKVVRGLLCACCNQAIGLMGDSPELLMAAARYLQAHMLAAQNKES